MAVQPSDICSVRCTLFCMNTEAVLNRTQLLEAPSNAAPISWLCFFSIPMNLAMAHLEIAHAFDPI